MASKRYVLFIVQLWIAGMIRFAIAGFLPFQLEKSHQRFQLSADEATNPAIAKPVPKLDVIEVDVPVRVPPGPSCSAVLMEYSFGNTYGSPFIGSYAPPSCDFNRVVLNFTVLSTGRQFDRLAMMYLNDTEIWRTSTAEPTANGIIWTYQKDISEYLSLFRQPQKVIFDLGNIVNDVYTAPFNTTLIATFYNSNDASKVADLILPVSARRASRNQGSAWFVPEFTAADKVQIPRNVKRAVFSVAACGQQTEEFWWSNVLSSTTNTFINNTLYGYSTFREVQVLIDGELAGVVWPFPIIFTGGIVPSFWRPLVGIDTYDLREDEIDITPWLPLLSDGKPHTFEMRVLGLSDDGKGHGVLTTVGGYWVVSGKLFLWLDNDQNSVTRGGVVVKTTPDPDFKWSYTLGVNSLARNISLEYEISAIRQLSIVSKIITSDGAAYATWTQSLTYSNYGSLTEGGYNQTNTQSTQGYDRSSSGYSRRYSYPLYVQSYTSQDPNSSAFNLTGSLTRGKDVQTIGNAVHPTGLEQFSPQKHGYDGSHLSTRQVGEAGWIAAVEPRNTKAWAMTDQDYNFTGIFVDFTDWQGQSSVEPGGDMLFNRYVKAVNGTIAIDSNPLGNNGGQQANADEDADDDGDDEEGDDPQSFASSRLAELMDQGGDDTGAGPPPEAGLEIQE